MGWPQTITLFISASWVVRVTVMILQHLAERIILGHGFRPYLVALGVWKAVHHGGSAWWGKAVHLMVAVKI
jgi:hypothetical protein